MTSVSTSGKKSGNPNIQMGVVMFTWRSAIQGIGYNLFINIQQREKILFDKIMNFLS